MLTGATLLDGGFAMTVEQVVEILERQGSRRGLTATPGHQNYERAARLGDAFVPCRCSHNDPNAGNDYIAALDNGGHYYVGTSLRRIISCGPKGWHYYNRQVPPCV